MRARIAKLYDRLLQKLGSDDASLTQEEARLRREFSELQAQRAPHVAAAMAAAAARSR